MLFKEKLAKEKSIGSTDDLQEGKKEGFVKFCIMANETEMPYLDYGQEQGVKNLYISLKFIQKPFQRETFDINF